MKKEILLLFGLTTLSFGIYSFFKVPEIENTNVIIDESLEKDYDESISKEENLTFDVVRITKNGDAVIAGRGQPNKIINLYDGNEKIANIKTDANGEWVWTSETPLGFGIKKLNLKSNDATNIEEIISSEQTIIIFLEKNSQNEPIVFKTSNSGIKNSVLLNLDKLEKGIVLDMVEYSLDGKIILSGRSEEEKELVFFLDEDLIGKTNADHYGNWIFKTKKKFKYGKINLRIDFYLEEQLVSFRTPIFMENMAEIYDKSNSENSFIVQPGNSLWRIARKTLGGGMLYSEIYKSNILKIRNPDLIFPGQVLDIPLLKENIKYER